MDAIDRAYLEWIQISHQRERKREEQNNLSQLLAFLKKIGHPSYQDDIHIHVHPETTKKFEITMYPTRGTEYHLIASWIQEHDLSMGRE